MSTTQGGGLWVQLEELFVFFTKTWESSMDPFAIQAGAQSLPRDEQRLRPCIVTPKLLNLVLYKKKILRHIKLTVHV
jgi:hypothetical protein